jgi:hypothetical protein
VLRRLGFGALNLWKKEEQGPPPRRVRHRGKRVQPAGPAPARVTVKDLLHRPQYLGLHGCPATEGEVVKNDALRIVQAMLARNDLVPFLMGMLQPTSATARTRRSRRPTRTSVTVPV